MSRCGGESAPNGPSQLVTSRACFLAIVALIPACLAASPTTQPAPDTRPRLLVGGFVGDVTLEARDAWLPTAVEETLAWRLRRVPDLICIPTQRCYQAQRELRTGDQDVAMDALARGLGATCLLTGRVGGQPQAVVVSLRLVRDGGDAAARSITLQPGRLPAVLDQATRWVLAEFGVASLDDALADRIFAPPSTSASALEYHARSLQALRSAKAADARRYAGEVVDLDPRFRPGLGLLAQLTMQGGRPGLAAATRLLRSLADQAKQENDLPDRANAELALSLLSQAEGASVAAETRALTALEYARGAQDVYAQIGALAWLCDLHLTWRQAEPDTPAPTTQAVEEHLRTALRWQQAHVALLEQLHDDIGLLPAASKLALIHEQLGAAEEAYTWHERTLALARQLGARRHEATAWLHLLQWHRGRQRWDDALGAGQKCLALAEPLEKPAVHVALAGVQQSRGDQSAALAEFTRAYEILKPTTDLPGQLLCLREMARLQQALGQPAAMQTLQDAVDVANALEAPEAAALKAQLDAWRAGR